MTMPVNNYQWAIEGMSLSGRGVSLRPCSRSTLYRWAKECNAILERDGAEWRVKADPRTMSLDIVKKG